MKHIHAITTPAMAAVKQDGTGLDDIFDQVVNLIIVSLDAAADVILAIFDFANTDGTITKDNA